MKKMISISYLLLITVSTFGQSASIKDFYRKYKKTEDTFHINAPGWLIRLGGAIARKHIEDEGERALVKLLGKKVRKARILIMEDHNSISKAEFNDFLSDLRSENFETLVQYREDGEKINILGREKGDKIKDLLVLVQEPDSFIMVAMKTKLKPKDLAQIIELAVEDDRLAF
ncbi:MAG: DUF4252 domain-containing protein [Bacteroidota bacterium]